jgi:hypothetical protein
MAITPYQKVDYFESFDFLSIKLKTDGKILAK